MTMAARLRGHCYRAAEPDRGTRRPPCLGRLLASSGDIRELNVKVAAVAASIAFRDSVGGG